MKPKLFAEERYRQILDALKESGRISVDELSISFGISQVTIRSDLQHLASLKLLHRTHGGAIQATSSDEELAFTTRVELHSPEKERIGRLAASLVKNGEVIALDASTTALAIADHLVDKSDLTIVTNGLALANRMLPIPGITLYLVGGFLRRDALSLVGMTTNDLLPELNIHRFFFSANGLTIQNGLTEMNAQEGAMKEVFIRHSRQAIAVLDSSKIGQASLHTFAELLSIHTIITNPDVPKEYLTKLKGMGIEILFA